MRKKLALISVLVIALFAGSLNVQAQDSSVSGKITVWAWANATDALYASGIMDDFAAAYPDIEIELVNYGTGDVYTNLALALTAGEGACDLCLVESSHVSEFVQLGGLADLTDRIGDDVDNILPFRWQDVMYDGGYYAVPWDAGPVVLYYRRDIFEQAGLPSDPEGVAELIPTWDAYLDACTTIKETTGHMCFPHSKANNNARMYEKVLWSLGLGYYDAESGDVTVDSPKNIAALEMLGKFWDADVVSDTAEWTDPWYADFSSPDAAIASYVGASWMDGNMRRWMVPDQIGLWGVAPMPAFEDGAQAANDGGSVFVIPEQSTNKDAAWALASWITLNKDITNSIFEESGLFPSYLPALDSPIFDEPDDYFAGQAVRRIYADALQNIPTATVYGPHYAIMNETVSVAIQRYATGELSAEEALQEAAEEIRFNIE
ncbi:MAG TPA: sugar ABC transporter substrate-binding protein [Aggregatilinea sp.]|uniref:ABC transporter substrate-binding protein n=1 Tax=Aggregatilinea sp. TaxID=2806333 RepID=UPI002C9A2161|nr:sugar ABC transporter substrate-binding protein [Aggregatilinea sp.]HML20231.1 sugar ABC transporter substrate-binding protein [Aggregatilinea sp.]